MNKPNPKVDGYIRKNKQWGEELEALRRIILECGLVEEVKWRVPCYTVDGANVIILGAFKNGAVISFVKGALLKDPKGVLVKPGENTQGARVVRFMNAEEIAGMEKVLKDLIRQAVEVEKAGGKVEFKKITEHKVPEELAKKWEEMPELEKAFRGLTPGRQRAYLIYFSGAKQSKTREARIEKYVKRILGGKGMED